ncbi:uncharacterized protein LOC131026697 [Cryptomeria japonica]|uniref:uncharacterized protein LOC131026697 n=1 Tax=Cryptomeria japonica TaxID=3369 RepID=UPI0027DA763C|nr:uncharacterized protein LOC131026697 [Cryptomeria japonica]
MHSYSPADVVLPLPEFDSACQWLESHTLVGRMPPESVLKDWVNKAWVPHGVRLEMVQNLTKGFFLFCFSEVSHVQAILGHSPWYVWCSLLVFQAWTCDFAISDETKLRVPVWIEFPGLPLPCVPFLNHIASSLGRVVCVEPDRFFQSRPQKVTYFNLPNMCYHCQSADHKIKDCPLAVPRTPSPLGENAHARQVDSSAPKQDSAWTMVTGHRNKSSGLAPTSNATESTKNVSNPSQNGTVAPIKVNSVPL